MVIYKLGLPRVVIVVHSRVVTRCNICLNSSVVRSSMVVSTVVLSCVVRVANTRGLLRVVIVAFSGGLSLRVVLDACT